MNKEQQTTTNNHGFNDTLGEAFTRALNEFAKVEPPIPVSILEPTDTLHSNTNII